MCSPRFEMRSWRDAERPSYYGLLLFIFIITSALKVMFSRFVSWLVGRTTQKLLKRQNFVGG